MDKPTIKKENAKEGIKVLIMLPIMIIIIFFMGFLFFGIIMTTLLTTIQLMLMEEKGFIKSWKEAKKETITIIHGLL